MDGRSCWWVLTLAVRCEEVRCWSGERWCWLLEGSHFSCSPPVQPHCAQHATASSTSAAMKAGGPGNSGGRRCRRRRAGHCRLPLGVPGWRQHWTRRGTAEDCCQLLGRGTRATFIARRSHIVTGVDDGDRQGRDRVEPSLRGPSPTNCQMVPLRALLRAPSGDGQGSSSDDSRGTSVTGCMTAWAAGVRELRPSTAFCLSIASVCACLGCCAHCTT